MKTTYKQNPLLTRRDTAPIPPHKGNSTLVWDELAPEPDMWEMWDEKTPEISGGCDGVAHKPTRGSHEGSKREVNAACREKGEILPFHEECKETVHISPTCTVVMAPSVCREKAQALMCATIRKELQNATLEHIAARQSGNRSELTRCEARIADLRASLVSNDPREDSASETTEQRPRLLQRILRKVGFGLTL